MNKLLIKFFLNFSQISWTCVSMHVNIFREISTRVSCYKKKKKEI